jgi:hypothetical protein
MTCSHISNHDLSACPGGLLLLLLQDEDALELAKAAIKLKTPAGKTPTGAKRKPPAQQAPAGPAGKKQKLTAAKPAKPAKASSTTRKSGRHGRSSKA